MDPGTGLRSIATVLFADICDFTAHCRGLPPEDAVALANQYFETLASPVYANGGVIDKYIGDALMAVFPGSALRAARAALEMRTLARDLGRTHHARLGVRIGMHTGPVARAEIGDTRHRPWTVMGDTVNLARRIEAQARPGGILVSTATRRALEGHMLCLELPSTRIKGFDVPVGLHELMDVAHRGDRPVVGRERELEILDRFWHDVKMGTPRAICLVGPPGMGKRALFEAWRHRRGLRAVRIGSEICWSDGTCKIWWLDTPAIDDQLALARERHQAGGWMLLVPARGYQWEKLFTLLPFQRLDLPPLDADSAGRLLDMLPGTDKSRRREGLLDRAAGNPMALVEMGGSLSGDLPIGLICRVQLHIDTLPDRARTWLGRFAVWQGPISGRHLPDDEARSQARLLMEDGLMRSPEWDSLEVVPYVRQCLNASESPSTRKAHHEWAARERERIDENPELVVWHWFLAGRPDEALSWLDRTLTESPISAMHWLSEALEHPAGGIWPGSPDVPGLGLRLARLAHLSSHPRRARYWIGKARPRDGAVRLLDAEVRLASGDLSSASRTLAAARRSGLSTEMTRRAIELEAWIALRQGQPSRVITLLHTRAENLDTDGRLHGLCGIAHTRRGEYEDARQHHRRALHIRQNRGDRPGMVASMSNLGMVAREREDHREAHLWYDRAMSLLDREVATHARASLMANLGDLAMAEGDLIIAEARIEQSRRWFAQLGDVIGVGSCWCALGEVYRRRGCLDHAATVLHRGRRLLDGAGSREWRIETWTALGDVAWQRGARAIARRWWRDAKEEARRTGRTDRARKLDQRLTGDPMPCLPGQAAPPSRLGS